MFSATDREKKALLIRKGVYCYEWADSFDKLEKTKTLPPHEDFASKLTNQNVALSDYVHVRKKLTLVGVVRK